MSDREPGSMEEFFEAEYAETGAPEQQEVLDGEPLDDSSAPLDRDDQQDEEQEPDRLSLIEEQLAALRNENATKDQMIANMIHGVRQQAEQQRAQEIQGYQQRWSRGIATGELSQEDVLREREALIARHAMGRITELESENTTLRNHQIAAQEAEAKTQVIGMIAKQFTLTPREQKYIATLNDPYEMETLARQFQEDRGAQTVNARRAAAASRSGPVHRATGGPPGAPKQEEPTSMLDYFKSVPRRA